MFLPFSILRHSFHCPKHHNQFAQINIKMNGGVVALIAILAVVAVQRGEAVSCDEVGAALLPCVNFLIGHDLNPPEVCCAGVRRVKGLAVSPADTRAACDCVKAAANRYSDLKETAAQSLPTKCDVPIDIPISRTVDCDKIA